MRNNRGFTFPELMVVTAILLMLAGLTLGNLFSLRQNVSISTSVDTLIADIKEQQIKAMIGDTEGRATADSYGIFFEATRYSLFHGTYSTTDPGNFVVNLDQSVQFTDSTFPSNQIIFAPQSGEVGFSTGAITIKDPKSAKQRTITINKYGVVTAVN